MNRLLATIERRLGLTPAGVAAVAGIVATGLVANGVGSRQLMLLAFGGLATIGIAAALGTRRLDVAAERSDITSRINQGRGVRVTVTLTAKSRTAGVLLREQLPAQLGGSRAFAVDLLRSGQSVERDYTLQPTRRGIYRVGPLDLEWSDPFGLTRRRRTVLEPATVIVHPAREPAHDRIISRAWEDPPVRPPVSKPWPTGFEFYGMRDYVHGDDPRRIVWRASARTIDEHGGGRYLVREAEQGITDTVHLWLDTDRRNHEHPELTFELAVRAAASLGVRHLEDGLSVSLESNSGPLAQHLRGRPAQVQLLDRLAEVEVESAPLGDAIQRLLFDADRTAHNIVLTPFLSQDVATRMRYLLERGTSLLIVLLVTDDSDPVSAHRAGTLGCSVVELDPSSALERTFQHVVNAAVRR